MVRRHESMAARNGEIEAVSQEADSGVGVRALVGSGWGFFATPDLGDRAVRGAGAMAAEIAAASALVSRGASALLPGVPATGSWASECVIDPFSVALSDKGDLLVRATTTMGEHGADLAEAMYQAWETRKWFVSSEGHRIDQHVRECGAGIAATAIGDGETQHRSYPAARGQYATLGWEFVDGLDLGAHAARVGSEARELLECPGVPQWGDDVDPRRRAAGVADPRVRRPRDRARPDPRVGGRLRGHVVARPGPARFDEVRVGADEHHDRSDDPGRSRIVRLRRRRHAGGTARRRPRGHVGRRPGRAGLGRRRRVSTTQAACGPTDGLGSRWSG